MISDAIETFLTAARHMSFRRAAEERFVTQPTVSRQIAALEEQWGVRLFRRDSRGVSLTPQGQVMLEVCQKMDGILEEGVAQARRIAQGRQGQLRVGFLCTLDEGETLVPIARHFEHFYPGIEVSVERASYAPLRAGLERGAYDVVFTLDFDAENMSDVCVERLEELRCSLVVSSTHPLYGKPDLSPADFEGATFVIPSPEDSPGRREDLLPVLRALELRNWRTVYAPNLDTVYLELDMGRAAALLCRSERCIQRPNYRALPLPRRAPFLLDLVVIWKKENQNPALSLFLTGI